MRVLCDQNVPEKYLRALRDADFITAATVRGELRATASDEEIATFAEADDWVLLSNDDDFFVESGDHGFLFYSQIDDPSPGEVVRTIRAIESAYDEHDDVLETVPDGWI